ncbi:NPCBM/NEW2 domain-containing protein [Candidatus Uabimicrobium amorphum]|uniref:Alpha-galactosidase n=1 Tax=Uabimicrobium amorphum TaxID=2596890 RepID=A0A5S9IIX5_UABAM|nr:NPCBM/NEW2 domain-containing protein [Candidatus Uabimicrobium amorphum]BBM82698.1 alpha-galactosidase [Candidatus Uabimicrobium amorphum]
MRDLDVLSLQNRQYHTLQSLAIKTMKYTLFFVMSCLCIVQLNANFEISTLGNKTYTGNIIKFDKNRQQISFSTTGNQVVNIFCQDIIKIENTASLTKVNGTEKIVLSDSSVLYGKITDGSSQAIGVQTNLLEFKDIDLMYIKDIYFDGSATQGPANSSENDVLYFKSGDVMRGIIEQFGQDFVEIEHEQLGKRKELFSKLNRVSFAALEPLEKQEFSTNIVGFDNSNLSGNIEDINGGIISLKTVMQDTLRIPLSKVRFMFFKNGRFVYVSDLPEKKLRTRYVPYFPNMKIDNVVKRDQSYGGKPLRIRGQRFFKGLGVISKTEINLRLNGKFKKFRCYAGVDDEIAERYKKQSNFLGGSVVFRILLDGKTAYQSNIVYHFSKPISIDLNVANKNSMTLVVDFGDNAHVNDYANWGDAILVR